MHKMLAAFLISVWLIPAGAFAQPSPTRNSADVTIRMPDVQRPTGIMGGPLTRESFRLAALASAMRQQQPRKRSWPGRHPVLFGALVGLGIGLGVEAAVIPGESGGEPHSAYIPMFATIGAGVGSLTGLIVSAARR